MLPAHIAPSYGENHDATADRMFSTAILIFGLVPKLDPVVFLYFLQLNHLKIEAVSISNNMCEYNVKEKEYISDLFCAVCSNYYTAVQCSAH